MYKDFFGFSEEPFNLNPDPVFLYMTMSHWEAFSTMMEGIRERKGIILITGDVGTGKTTLIHALLKDLSDQIKTAFIFNPRVTFKQLLKGILRELDVRVGAENTYTFLYKFDEYLREKSAADETVVILIDEAQVMSPTVLANLDRLLQRDAAQTKVLQTLLVGQLELEAHLDSEELRQFKRRIAVQRRIRPLSREESEGYIDHRLKKVGSGSSNIFTPAALQLICDVAKGIPRVINLICDGALFEGYNKSSRKIGIELVRKALVEKDIIAGEEALELAEIAGEEGALQREGIAAGEEPSTEEENITAHEVVTAQGARVKKEEIAAEKPALVREAATEKEATGEQEIMVEKETMGEMEPLSPRLACQPFLKYYHRAINKLFSLKSNRIFLKMGIIWEYLGNIGKKDLETPTRIAQHLLDKYLNTLNNYPGLKPKYIFKKMLQDCNDISKKMSADVIEKMIRQNDTLVELTLAVIENENKAAMGRRYFKEAIRVVLQYFRENAPLEIEKFEKKGQRKEKLEGNSGKEGMPDHRTLERRIESLIAGLTSEMFNDPNACIVMYKDYDFACLIIQEKDKVLFGDDVLAKMNLREVEPKFKILNMSKAKGDKFKSLKDLIISEMYAAECLNMLLKRI